MVIALMTLAGAIGCSSDNTRSFDQPAGPALQMVEINKPPKELVKIARDVVTSAPYSLGVESEQKGQIVTGWREYQGEWHIGRHWVERSRYRIIVLPDFDEPTARSHVQVLAETQESIPVEPRKWHDNPALVRPQRAKELLSAIQQKAGG
jgi:hypothetical protein